MAELSAEERARQEGAITRLLDAAAPAIQPSRSSFFPVQGSGSMAAYFTQLQQNSLMQIRSAAAGVPGSAGGISPQDMALLQQSLNNSNNPNREALRAAMTATGVISDTGQFQIGPMRRGTAEDQEYVISSLMAAKLEAEKARLRAAYLNGAATNNSTTVTGNPGDTMSLITGAMGIDMGGMFGRIAGMVSQVPVVGDYLLAIGRTLGSGVEWALGKIGIGDRNAEFVGPFTAYRQIQDSKRFGGGAAALTQNGVNVSINDLVNELRNSANNPGAAPAAPPRAVQPVMNNNRAVEGTGRAAFRAAMEGAANFPGDEQKRQAMIRAIDAGRSNGTLSDTATYMLVTMPDNTLAIAVGNVNDSGANFTPQEFLTVGGDGKLTPVANAPATTGMTLQTGRTPTLEFQVSQANLLERTFAANVIELQTNMVSVNGTVPNEVSQLVARMQAQPNRPEFNGKSGVLATMPGGGYAVLLGEFRPGSNEFVPQSVVRLDNNNGLDIKPLASARPMPLKPTFDNATSVSGAPATLEEMGSKTGLPDNAANLPAAIRSLGASAIKRNDLKHMVLRLPGNTLVLVSGTTESIPEAAGRPARTVFRPVYETAINPDGTLGTPQAATEPDRTLDVTGRTDRSLVQSLPYDQLMDLVPPALPRNGGGQQPAGRGQ